ncbi:hypothetical protein GCM10010405_22900 [Streptomyces macrosporus]|uniref:Transposase IS4-like domain-containing protein n=1 Tax=Streptomyces macrosporus TaxID=44032 RepID=A0ABP5X0S9_9ACTN
MICDAGGVPLAVALTGGDRNDVTWLIPLLEAIPPIRGKRGRPREVYADRGYDHACHRRQAWAKGIRPVIARRGTEHGSGLGTRRWVVEQPSPCCTASVGRGPAGRSATTSMRRSCGSAAR